MELIKDKNEIDFRNIGELSEQEIFLNILTIFKKDRHIQVKDKIMGPSEDVVIAECNGAEIWLAYDIDYGIMPIKCSEKNIDIVFDVINKSDFMSNTTEVLLTIVGIQHYEGRFPFSAGRQLIAAKEPENKFDKNAIKILDMGNTTVGYIANKPDTALDGTITADKVYNLVGDYFVIEVVCSTNVNVTCKIVEPNFTRQKLIDAFTKNRYDADYPFTDIYPPKCDYPFDFDEFPFEYNLIDIDITDELIPIEWREYIACCDLDIDEVQITEIQDIVDFINEKGDFYIDTLEILYNIRLEKDKESKTVEQAILDCIDMFDEYPDLTDENLKEISKISKEISDILKRKPRKKGDKMKTLTADFHTNSTYNIIMSTGESTVVAEYTSEHKKSDAYQSEAELEKEFIRMLTEQGYEYITVHNEKALISNLRTQLEALNNYTFTNEEWDRFFNECIANKNESIVEKTKKIQADYIQILKRDDGTAKNIYLIDKKNIHNNRLQVLNQYEESEGTHKTRYDVTILVNGLPLVHCELKRRGVAIREAFNQIKRYQRDSFWAASGLYEYIQIFVISNGTHTKYYSNTTRSSHIKEISDSNAKASSKKTSHSFEFTSFWADASNKIISDLVDFTKTFLAKHTILNILTRYCVFTSENLLLVMRPYQIAATEQILNRIEISTNYKKYGSTDGGGYIWHTTGSGKTLTSFKTAQLACNLPYIDKVLFVVDRKDLDYQTIKEYDRFQKGAADGNTSTKVLQQQLESDNTRIIITTIQKLGTFISKNKTHDIYNKHVVMIFDECHRSQFGDMHLKITKAFKMYHIFGFTGTPIFAANAGSGGNPQLKTTPQAFGDKLHTYTIVDAINDGNVLPFRVDYINTVKMADNVTDKQVRAIDIDKAMNDPKRIADIVTYIIDHFDQKTKRNSFYSLKGQRVAGFNSILAVSSIPTAKMYYNEFQRQLQERRKNLTVATIFSFSANEDDPDDVLSDESFDTDKLDQTSRDFLDGAIKDYNKTFNTNFDTSADKFQNYYKDLSMRVKQREVDLLIVVNMFLTGFDATTLNTLWVDKNLKMHGLIQAFSRTNRILNSVKTYGNIVCFRDLQDEVNAAIALFGDRDAGGIVLMRTYDEYMNGYEDDKGVFHIGYADLVRELQDKFPVGVPIEGEQAQKEFIKLYGAILRLRNILMSFDKFEEQDILTDRDRQDYQSIYIDLYQELTPKADGEKENINADIVFELELIKQVDINIDYILMLVEKYHNGNCEDKQVLATIDRAINASIELRSKKELIQGFINSVNADSDVNNDWVSYVSEQKEKDIEEIIKEQRLNPDETRKFINNSFRDGYIKTTGIEIDRIMPPISIFDTNRQKTEQGIIERLKGFFNKYFGIE